MLRLPGVPLPAAAPSKRQRDQAGRRVDRVSRRVRVLVTFIMYRPQSQDQREDENTLRPPKEDKLAFFEANAKLVKFFGMPPPILHVATPMLDRRIIQQMAASSAIPEEPIVTHYVQKMDCAFVQEALKSVAVRLSTFPIGWEEENGLGVTARKVAAAGFVHYPPTQDEASGKLALNNFVRLGCTTSICPRCLAVVDWKEQHAAASLSLDGGSSLHGPSCTARVQMIRELQEVRAKRKVDATERCKQRTNMLNVLNEIKNRKTATL